MFLGFNWPQRLKSASWRVTGGELVSGAGIFLVWYFLWKRDCSDSLVAEGSSHGVRLS